MRTLAEGYQIVAQFTPLVENISIFGKKRRLLHFLS